MQQPTVRPATEADIPQLLGLIRQLALHEGRPEAAVATENGLADWLFARRAAEAQMIEADGVVAGYLLYYPTFSTFQGACNLYLEDVYITPEFRGRGYGRQMMEWMLEKARAGGYGALQWSCLNNNTGSLAFYDSLGAKRKPQGTGFYIPVE